MTFPTAEQVLAAIDATWPAASVQREGPWLIRDGQGGGKRVSAATAAGPVSEGDIATAEAAMRDLEQTPLFMIADGDAALDRWLDARGYVIVDPVVLYVGAVEELAAEPLPRVASFEIWPPLAIMEELWAAGGIGPARLAVMARAADPKTAILGRTDDTPSGAAFVSAHENIAMIHAIEVSSAIRRRGTGRNILRAASKWAQNQGISWLALAVTEANAPARALYSSLGMRSVGHYHYRSEE